MQELKSLYMSFMNNLMTSVISYYWILFIKIISKQE